MRASPVVGPHVQPRSMSRSTSSASHSSGTSPVIRNHVVDHGVPQAVPCPASRYSASRARANGTGSPSTSHMPICNLCQPVMPAA